MKEPDRLITIKVKPRASRSGVEQQPDGGLVVRVHSPASEGAANRECEAVLAKALGVPKSSVQIVRGEKSRTKQIMVSDLSAAEIKTRLTQLAKGQIS